MPFCPQCKTEYMSGATRCFDCGVPLVGTLAVDEPGDYVACPRCSEQITADSDYCSHCGTLKANVHFFCETHSASSAIAVCIICRRLLCSECVNAVRGRVLCPEHKSVEVSEDWAVVFQSTDYYEANIIRGKLESAGITVNPRNNTSIGFIADGFIESAIGRTILRYPVKIFVPLDQYLIADEVLKEELPLAGE